MTGLTFQRARRTQARLRLALVAVSGAGKTMSSLRLARGIVEQLIDMGVVQGGLEGKIAVIDTERASAALYADVCPFDTLVLEPPYSVDRYQQALDAAERAGYVICIIDQISHAWAGPGGQLEYVDTLKAQSRNAISPWAKVTPLQQEFYDRLLRSPMHIIATMRAKTEYVIEEQIIDGRKKNVPKKIGLAPVQRDGIEYEFTACLDIDLEGHTATASKDRTRLFMGKTQRLDETVGRKVAEWLQSGEAIALEPSAPPPAAGPSNPPAQKEDPKAALIKQLDDAVTDYELGFLDCHTLPDLASHFDKAQRYVRGYVKDLGAEVVKPYLDRVIAAKDKRKTSLAQPPEQQQKPAGPARTILWNEKREVIAELAQPARAEDEVKVGEKVYVVGALAQKTADGETWYAREKGTTQPPVQPAAELFDQADRLTIEDVKRLASFAVNEGLSDEETLAALGVKELGELPQNAYASATEKIMQAARAKLKKPRGRRERAAA